MENKEERNRQIIRERETGLSYAKIAEKHGVSRSLVEQIVHHQKRMERFEQKHPGFSKLANATALALARCDIQSVDDLTERLNKGEKLKINCIGSKRLKEICDVTGIQIELKKYMPKDGIYTAYLQKKG